MSIATLVLGTSGTGKSTSLRNLDPAKTLLIQCIKKPLPFRAAGWKVRLSLKSEGNVIQTSDPVLIEKLMRTSPHEIVVVDDYQAVMVNELMNRSSEKGYDKFTDIGKNAWNIFNAAGALADAARARGMNVRGVMGYEGHLMMVTDRAQKQVQVHEAMALLAKAHADVGGDIMSAGGTGTFDMFDGTAVNEVQAGSYALMDTQYALLGHPFRQSLWILGTVISVSATWCVIDVGLKSLGMDHGNPTIDGFSVWFCSDEHTTIAPREGEMPSVGDRIRVTPAHVDPTMAMHERAFVLDGDTVVDEWAIDLRGW